MTDVCEKKRLSNQIKAFQSCKHVHGTTIMRVALCQFGESF